MIIQPMADFEMILHFSAKVISKIRYVKLRLGTMRRLSKTKRSSVPKDVVQGYCRDCAYTMLTIVTRGIIVNIGVGLVI